MRKKYTELPRVTNFFQGQSAQVCAEYMEIVNMLEQNGRLVMPFGEALPQFDLYAIRIIRAANVRVFYIYGKNDRIFGLHAYEKKTQKIPIHERKIAQKIASILKQKVYI